MYKSKTLWAFPGLHYFEDTEVDQQLFFGRTREIQELTERILAENITILFGKSGDGKTSLINAGIKPRFRELDYLPVRARIFNAPKENSLFQLLYQTVENEAAEQNIKLPNNWPAETLWESFYHLQATEANALKPILLILDQFEELFTLFANRTAEQDAFIEQFADLVRGRIPALVRERFREQLQTLTPGTPEFMQLEKLLYGNPLPPIKILVSLREDYLAYLDNLGQKIPKVYDSRYRLPALNLVQAREAIENPPAQAVLGENQFLIEKEAVSALLEFLKMSTSRSGVLEEVVGPPQLQVICRQLEKGMREQGKKVIELADLGGEKGLRRLLTQYYQDITQTIPRLRLGAGPRKSSGPMNLLRRLLPVHFPRTAVHHLCEDRLITAGGNRNTRHEDEIIHEIGVAKADLEHLVDSRLLRREPRLNEAFYELSHDSLVPSLQTTGKFRKNMAMAARLLVVGLLIFTVVYWGIPYFQRTYTIYKLDQSLDLMKKQKVSIFDFRLELYRAKNRLQDSGQLGHYLDELKQCFFAQKAPHLQQADSLIETINWIYPREDSLIKALKDSLRDRRIQYVQLRYHQLVGQDSINFQLVSNFLDSAYLALQKDNRILELQTDLANRQQDRVRAKQLAGELERQNKLAEEQLRAAIQLREPRSLQIKWTASLEIVLENHPLLRNAQVFLNDREMPFKRIGNTSLRSAAIRIPQNANEVTVQIKVIDNQKIEAKRDFVFQIDRTPPELKNWTFSYKENATDEWQKMPDAAWKGTYWQLAAEASENLWQGQIAITGFPGKKPYTMNGRIAANRKLMTFQLTTNDLMKSAIFPDQAESMNMRLKLEDLAGLQSEFNLGTWKILKVVNPAQQLAMKSPATQAVELVINLRSTPGTLSENQVRDMLKKYDFYDSDYNPSGKGLANRFKPVTLKGEKVVLDEATGLMWQQGGSPDWLTRKKADEYVRECNRQKMAGFSDWRLPTLEEAMSLMEPKKDERGLYIDPRFDGDQRWIWTADAVSGGSLRWVVSFVSGNCSDYYVNLYDYLLLVRSGHSFTGE